MRLVSREWFLSLYTSTSGPLGSDRPCNRVEGQTRDSTEERQGDDQRIESRNADVRTSRRFEQNRSEGRRSADQWRHGVTDRGLRQWSAECILQIASVHTS